MGREHRHPVTWNTHTVCNVMEMYTSIVPFRGTLTHDHIRGRSSKICAIAYDPADLKICPIPYPIPRELYRHFRHPRGFPLVRNHARAKTHLKAFELSIKTIKT
jgi:hypothetical protein